MDLSINTSYRQSFTGNKPKHAAKNIGDLMSVLYKKAYGSNRHPHNPDILQISTTMHDGKEVVAVADFHNGKYVGISFPYELAHYRKEFCKKILEKYNFIITKGKSTKFR